MKYDVLLIDADDTLLDFKKSENISFQLVLKKHDIDGDEVELLKSYKKINEILWNNHDLGLITKDFLKVERFKKFLEENQLEADPLELSEDYLNTLPHQVYLVEGALELLKNLHGKIPLVIVTNGIGPIQHKRLHNSGLKPFIDIMVVSEECGFSKPDKRIFDYTLDLLKTTLSESRILMIGDKIETDILGACNFGIDSCWFNPQKRENQTPHVPTYEVQSLIEIIKLLK